MKYVCFVSTFRFAFLFSGGWEKESWLMQKYSANWMKLFVFVFACILWAHHGNFCYFVPVPISMVCSLHSCTYSRVCAVCAFTFNYLCCCWRFRFNFVCPNLNSALVLRPLCGFTTKMKLREKKQIGYFFSALVVCVCLSVFLDGTRIIINFTKWASLKCVFTHTCTIGGSINKSKIVCDVHA